MGDLLPLVCWGAIFLANLAVDVGGVDEVMDGLSWPSVIFPEVTDLICLLGIRCAESVGFLLDRMYPWVEGCVLADRPAP